jgi:hypothetical protein
MRALVRSGGLAVGIALTALVVVLAGCSRPEPGAHDATGSYPPGRAISGIPLAPCTIKGALPVVAQVDGLCGTLTVPEDRTNAEHRHVTLNIAVIPAVANPSKPDPFVALAGGPGDPSTAFFAWLPGLYTDTYEEAAQAAADCAADPICSAPEVALVAPPPARGATPASDVDALVARAIAARDGAPPLHLTMTRWRTKGGEASRGHLDYVGPGRHRVEWDADRVAGGPGRTTIAIGTDEGYESVTAEDRSVTWRHWLGPIRDFATVSWLDDVLIGLPGECSTGWRLLGVDRVGTATANHLECEGVQYWVDRATSLVVRRQSPADEMHGIEVLELVDLNFGPPPDSRFRLPDGAVMEVPPTLDPNFVPTPGPQPAPSE